MTNTEIILASNEALESDDPRSAAPYFTEDFTYSGTLERTIDRQGFLMMMMAIKKGFPDFALNLRLVQEISPDVVKATIAPVGTHTNTFALPGLPPIPATGMTVALPRQLAEYTIRGQQICRARMEHASAGGIKGLLEALGLEISPGMLGRIIP